MSPPWSILTCIQETGMGVARISVDLGDPRLLKLLRIETRAPEKMSASVFSDWDNPLDSDYDKL